MRLRKIGYPVLGSVLVFGLLSFEIKMGVHLYSQFTYTASWQAILGIVLSCFWIGMTSVIVRVLVKKRPTLWRIHKFTPYSVFALALISLYTAAFLIIFCWSTIGMV